MDISQEFNRYVAHLSEGLGHADRHAGLSGYCTGLMLPLSRKSVEPMAARVDPLHASARHQALHHFVAKSEWSDATVMARVRDWVMPSLGLDGGRYWIIDDTGFPKKGKHSVGVARQYCGQLGKQDNCQVAARGCLHSPFGLLPTTPGAQIRNPAEYLCRQIYALIGSHSHPCGRSLTLVGGIRGRADQMKKVKGVNSIQPKCEACWTACLRPRGAPSGCGCDPAPLEPPRSLRLFWRAPLSGPTPWRHCTGHSASRF